MKYKTFYKTKIFNSKCELRSYEVENLLETGIGAKIIIGDEFMEITPTQLKKGEITNTVRSLYKQDQVYHLIGFEWKPTGRLDEQVTIPFDARVRLAEMWRKIQK